MVVQVVSKDMGCRSRKFLGTGLLKKLDRNYFEFGAPHGALRLIHQCLDLYHQGIEVSHI